VGGGRQFREKIMLHTGCSRKHHTALSPHRGAPSMLCSSRKRQLYRA